MCPRFLTLCLGKRFWNRHVCRRGRFLGIFLTILDNLVDRNSMPLVFTKSGVGHYVAKLHSPGILGND